MKKESIKSRSTAKSVNKKNSVKASTTSGLVKNKKTNNTKDSIKSKNNIQNSDKEKINWSFVGAIAAIIMPILVLIISLQIEYIKEKNIITEGIIAKEKFIQNIKNGQTINSINKTLGEPIYTFKNGVISNNYYRVNYNVIKCIFDHQELVGYLVFINPNNPLEYNTWVDDNSQLGYFTYNDIDSVRPYKKEYSFSGTTPTYRYYFEIYEGFMSRTNGEYYLFGNFMDTEIDLIADEFEKNIKSGHTLDDNGKFYLDNNRDSIKPNVYGQINEEYISKVKCIDENINNRNMTDSIFVGYYSYDEI